MTQALDISRETLGEKHDNTFVIMNDMATCLIMQEEYDQAETLLNEGIKKSARQKSLMESALLSNLGALYIRQRKLDKAEKACRKGLKIAEKGDDKFLKGPCEACIDVIQKMTQTVKDDDEDEKR